MLYVRSFVFSPIQENTYLVYNDQKDCIIIDPGCYFEAERDALANFISEHALKPQILLNTHCHLDHVFGNKFVAERFGLTLHLHPLEEKVLAFAPTSGLMYNLPFDQYQGDFNFIDDNQVIQLGQDQLRTIAAPGHSPGSICFYCEAQDFVIGGDVLFEGSIGRTDLPGGDHQTLLNSIRTRLWPLPDATVVYSGHGNPTTIGAEKLHNPYVGMRAIQ